MLEARDVTLRRGARIVLRDVTVAVGPGEMVALCGPNGAGKSSILAVLAGDLRPRSGEALIDGERIAALPARALAHRRAVLEQSPTASAPFTTRQLVALGVSAAGLAEDEAAAQVGAAMAAAGVAPLADRPVTQLSGGERARAHLARALAQRAVGDGETPGRYLLLDEPTASLDVAHQITVMQAARTEADGGVGVLAVLHDLSLAAAFADRIVVMADGAVAAVGPPRAVLTAERLSAIYRAPIDVRDDDGRIAVVPHYRRAAA